MSVLYLVACYLGSEFHSYYGVYFSKETAIDICNKNNSYENFHHSKDDYNYKIIEVPSEKPPIWNEC